MNIERPKRPEESCLRLPESYYSVISAWPELVPLLTAFEHRDYGTFMHSVAVHRVATKLVQDLFLRLDIDVATQQKVFDLSPFFILHDIGKLVASQNMEVAQGLVHPEDPTNRPSYDKALHWLHPPMGCYLLNIWASTASPRVKYFADKWANLARLHDKQLNPFLPNSNTEHLSWEEKFSLFVFSPCDTSMAMGLSRPNNGAVYDNTQIMRVLYKNHLNDRIIGELFPGQDPEELRQYICASIFDSLGLLQTEYPKSIWTHPVHKQDEERTRLVDVLVAESWRSSERYWDIIMMRMDAENVFA